VKKNNNQVINLGRSALAYCNIHGLWSNSLER
jgi:desulfoferrodoxin (superoxide reductase-like protein)